MADPSGYWYSGYGNASSVTYSSYTPGSVSISTPLSYSYPPNATLPQSPEEWLNGRVEEICALSGLRA